MPWGCVAHMAWKVRPVTRHVTWASVPTYRAVHRAAPHAWVPCVAHAYRSGSSPGTRRTTHVRPSHALRPSRESIGGGGGNGAGPAAAI